MFSVALLELSDDQIDMIREAVRVWCAAHGHDIDSHRGRSAMETAISLAQWDRQEPITFALDLERNLAATEGLPLSQA